MLRISFALAISLLLVAIPEPTLAQGFSNEAKGLHKILNNLYDTMIPLCSSLINVGKALAGLAALFYISARVWRHIAAAEPIDFFPLLRPFLLGICILRFSSVIAALNGILSPTVVGTSELVKNTNISIERLMAQREKERKESRAYKMYGVDGGDRLLVLRAVSNRALASACRFGRAHFTCDPSELPAPRSGRY